MNKKTHTYTVHEGIQTQQNYLKQWKKILQTWAYRELAAYCQYKNSLLPSDADGYQVFKGQELDIYIHNNIMTKTQIP